MIGTAGLSFFFGTEPVMATEMMQGVLMVACLLDSGPDFHGFVSAFCSCAAMRAGALTAP